MGQGILYRQSARLRLCTARFYDSSVEHSLSTLGVRLESVGAMHWCLPEP